MYSAFVDRITTENRQLKQYIKKLESADALEIIIADKEKVEEALRRQLKEARQGWSNCVSVNKALKYDNGELRRENSRLKKDNHMAEKRMERAQREVVSLKDKLAKKEELHQKDLERHKKDEAKIQDLEKKMEVLKDRVRQLEAEKDHDGTTSGIPTSQTPRGKEKRNPNLREQTGRQKGGQPGHKKHEKDPLSDSEITEEEKHEKKTCPFCGGNLDKVAELPPRDEVDYEVRVIKKRHRYYRYVCQECGRVIESEVPVYLKAKSQYGANTQAMILALLDLGFVSVERTRTLMTGLMGENVPSHGYVGKIQKKAARMLTDFREEVKEECLRQNLLHWDDTVVFMNTKRGCFRFYGNEKLALYYAHTAKDAKGIEADGILKNLKKETVLMHDHLTINYRKEYLFRNIECVQHLERDLQKNSNDTGHKWSAEGKALIQETIHKRKQYQAEGKTAFTDKETNEFENKLAEILAKAEKECEQDKNRYYHQDEQALINRMQKYKVNYFAWVYDFNLPTTNNLAESSLRMTKTKMKVSGQFLNERTATEFALVHTYIETCKRNGKDIFKALQLLMSGTPYTLQEVMNA